MHKINKIFKNKKILITGNTGFKGSWLSVWLNNYKAKLYGISLKPNTDPSMFKILKMNSFIKTFYLDITNEKKLKEKIKEIQPDFIFHFAAQPLVFKSLQDPINTFKSNTFGTLNLLNAVKDLKNKCTILMITSDKSYYNKEWIWGYREEDRIGGIDPYSASKSCAEIIIKSYFETFLKHKKNLRLGIARAGNVIGGGDWSSDRLIPDSIKAWIKKNNVIIRNPNSTRPWQHVLEPLGGYLIFASMLNNSSKLNGQVFNFGPNANNDYTVLDLVKESVKHWKNIKWKIKNNKNIESSLLKLNCDKANKLLNWYPSLNFEDTIKLTINWYKEYYFNKSNMYSVTNDDINFYISKFNKLYKKSIL